MTTKRKTAATQRQTPLYAAGVKAASERLMERLTQAGVTWPKELRSNQPPVLVRQMLIEAIRLYVEGAAVVRKGKRDYSETTKKFAAMAEGDVIQVPLQSRQTLRGRTISAREILNNPNAVWIFRDRGDHIEVSRMWDGADPHYRDPTANPRVVELASLEPGMSIISKTIFSSRAKGQMSHSDKIQARRLLDCPTANWSVRSTNQGIRLTRVA